MAVDSLKFADKNGKDWSIADLPVGLMEEFAAAAEGMYPDTENPWMHFLLDTIGSVCNMDAAIFQMTDIPVAAIDGLERVSQSCHYNRYSLFSVILQAAAANNLVLGRMHSAKSGPGDSVSIIITGIPTQTWEQLDEVSRTIDGKLFGEHKPSAMGVLMLLFEFASHGGFDFKVAARVDTAPLPVSATEPKKASAARKKANGTSGKRVGTFGSD